MRYSDEIIEEVLARNRIEDVIGESVRLKRAGSNLIGLCPFHNEKTPSFSVSPSKQMYYCFGCHAGGNLITFMMEYHNYTFVEALQYLADKAGIMLPEEELTREQKAASERNARLYEIYKKAAGYYYYRLRTPGGEQGLSYLKDRGLSDETIQHFGLGYSDKYGDGLYRYLKQKEYDDEILEATGLFRFDEKDGVSDRFWNRVMFPISDNRGRVIGFGGRVMGDGKPKYLNSPDSILFNKRRHLYALQYARSSRRGYIILCEGYMDVISMHQAGFTNACASLGTALTSEQASLLRRYTSEVMLLYDSDEAGQSAAQRAVPILREAGISAKVVDLKPYKDPDEFIRAEGADALEERLNNSLNGHIFEMDRMRKHYKRSDPAEWTAFEKAITAYLFETFTEEVERENYFETACSRYDLPKDAMRKMMARAARSGSIGRSAGESGKAGLTRSLDGGNAGTAGNRDDRQRKPDGSLTAQKLMLSYLVNYESAWPTVKGLISTDHFSDPVCKRIAEALFEQLENGKLSEAAILTRFPDSEDQKTAAAVFHMEIPVSGQKELDRAFTDTAIRLLQSANDERLRTMDPGDMTAYTKYLEERKRLEALKHGQTLHLEQ